MDAYYAYLNNLVNKNRQEFSGEFQAEWVNPYTAMEVMEKRNSLLSEINTSFFKETKPYVNAISKGCTLCGEGIWSCLFITNKCNAGCFYCPAPQTNDSVPSTQNLTFSTPQAYAEYINYFNFKAASFSGGEPLLYFERTLHYLQALRKLCKPDLYIWLYTNGILADKEKLRILAQNGLNEIRFDIGATNYSLDNVSRAAKFIENVTIEIPAVPEEKDTLIALLPAMAEAGIKYLNLHQLRLTKHNYAQFAKRNYTYIPAERPIVLESEMAALEIMKHAKDNAIPIGINYCSFHYKHRFQKAGYRKLLAEKFADNKSTITENGYIRNIKDTVLTFERFALHDENESSAKNDVLKLNCKNYELKRYAVSESYDITPDITNLIKQESDSIPTEFNLFKIWQNERLQRGLWEF